MKKMLTILAVLTLTVTSFASDRRQSQQGKKKKAKVTMVRGEKAKAIYNALDADITTKNHPKFSADIKKVASLSCSKLTNKKDTTVVNFRCALRGSKMKRDQRRRGQDRRGNGRQGRKK